MTATLLGISATPTTRPAWQRAASPTPGAVATTSSRSPPAAKTAPPGPDDQQAIVQQVLDGKFRERSG
jgi:hypothetical protein